MSFGATFDNELGGTDTHEDDVTDPLAAAAQAVRVDALDRELAANEQIVSALIADDMSLLRAMIAAKSEGTYAHIQRVLADPEAGLNGAQVEYLIEAAAELKPGWRSRGLRLERWRRFFLPRDLRLDALARQRAARVLHETAPGLNGSIVTTTAEAVRDAASRALRGAANRLNDLSYRVLG